MPENYKLYFQKLDGTILSLNLNCNTSTLNDVKRCIFLKYHILENCQRFIFKGKDLYDYDRLLVDWGIQNNDKTYLVLRLPAA